MKQEDLIKISFKISCNLKFFTAVEYLIVKTKEFSIAAGLATALPLHQTQQSTDQAGFRRNFCTNDHLFTTMMIQEIAQEWQIPVWTATLDFKKAFDTVSHDTLWTALTEQNV